MIEPRTHDTLLVGSCLVLYTLLLQTNPSKSPIQNISALSLKGFHTSPSRSLALCLRFYLSTVACYLCLQNALGSPDPLQGKGSRMTSFAFRLGVVIDTTYIISLNHWSHVVHITLRVSFSMSIPRPVPRAIQKTSGSLKPSIPGKRDKPPSLKLKIHLIAIQSLSRYSYPKHRRLNNLNHAPPKIGHKHSLVSAATNSQTLSTFSS